MSHLRKLIKTLNLFTFKENTYYSSDYSHLRNKVNSRENHKYLISLNFKQNPNKELSLSSTRSKELVS